MPEVTVDGGDFLQGWGNVIVLLVGAHLLALAFWIFKLTTEPSKYNKSEEDRE